MSELVEGVKTSLSISSTSLEDCLPNFEKKVTGKVRDLYVCKDMVIMVATDRQSAFDRQLASVPYKGQVMKQ